MPRGDGTGPDGQGRTGRRQGPCGRDNAAKPTGNGRGGKGGCGQGQNRGGKRQP